MDTSRNLAAIGFMLAATAFIAGTTLLAKMAGAGPDGLHPLQISQGRFLFAFLALWSAAAVLRPRITRPAWHLQGLRTLTGWGGVTLMFAAVQLIPLSDATAITFLNPVFAMVLAILVLGERIGRWRWLAAAIALPLSIRLPMDLNSDDPPIAMEREPPVPSAKNTWSVSPWT